MKCGSAMLHGNSLRIDLAKPNIPIEKRKFTSIKPVLNIAETLDYFCPKI